MYMESSPSTNTEKNHLFPSQEIRKEIKQKNYPFPKFCPPGVILLKSRAGSSADEKNAVVLETG